MTNQKSSYRQIFKATSLFGGVQVFNILISVIRSKFVAILLGPAGMGIMGLLTSSLGLVAAITNFGLSTSAVKDIASAQATGNEERISLVVSVFRKLIWITGTAGMLITIGFAPWISQLTFGNKDYTVAFICISVTLLINQLSSGQLVVLQGLRKLKKLAKANLTGSLASLFIVVPLYYLLGVNGIVPAIIGISLISLAGSWFFTRKIETAKIPISGEQVLSEGKSMLRMGLMLSMSSLLSIGATYIVRIYIGRTGGLDEVGLYNAGFTIINTYVGLIFTAMTTDYYPRLSAVSHDNKLCRQAINQQAEMALLIMAPILTAFIIFINWIILILYSKEFLEIDQMLYWAALGMFFKASSWAIAFVFLAKGDNNLFFKTELIANFLLTFLSVIGFKIGGLGGIGIIFAIYYFIYLLIVFFVCNIKYEFVFNKSYYKLFVLQFSIALFGILSTIYINNTLSYFTGLILVGISAIISYKELDKRMDIKELIKRRISRNN